MKIYIASRYARRSEMREYAAHLRQLGHEVVSTWIDAPETNDAIDASFRTRAPGLQEIAAEFAQENVNQIITAEMFLAFTEHPDEAYMGGGRHTEMGIALMAYYRDTSRRIVLVGPRENIFYHYNFVEQYDKWPDALLAIGADRSVGRQAAYR